MSTFSVHFETDNAAFQDGDGPAEIARILRRVADLVELNRTSNPVYDINGNALGQFDWIKP